MAYNRQENDPCCPWDGEERIQEKTMGIALTAPWRAYYGNTPASLDYPRLTMYQMVAETAKKYPKTLAYTFMGKGTTYEEFVQRIDRAAKGLVKLGIRKGNRVTICMPNTPQALDCFYALNRIGAIPNMIHPLSAAQEIAFYLNASHSKAVLTLDQFYGKVAEILPQLDDDCKVIIAKIADELPFPLSVLYPMTKAARQVPKLPKKGYTLWTDLTSSGKDVTLPKDTGKANDCGAILYSGGTTGTTKGIMLSNLNFNALGAQIIATNPMFRPGDKMLAVMPMFHGFGLGVSIHSMLVNGGCCILVPRFTPDSYAKLLLKYRCNLIAGVPTLYEALLRLPKMKNADLSCLKGVYSGGDSLSVELKKRFDKFLFDHHATIQVREGYGLTECVTASCLTPYHISREGSIGIPFPDTYYKIVEHGTQKELPAGTDGEICLAGPTVMMGYLHHPEETAQTLQTHEDGLTWVHTGDLGYMDEDGFVYFKQRIKRMIVTSGYNVYPSQMENIFDAHELVQMSCVIGVPDKLKMQKVKAFVMLKPGVPANEETKDVLMTYIRKNVAKYALPYDIEFRSELPKTLVGKVAYRVLEEEELKKLSETAQEK